MAPMSIVPGFLPSTHGLHFANRFPPGPAVRLGPFDTHLVRRDRRRGRRPVRRDGLVRPRAVRGRSADPARSEPPANGSALFQAPGSTPGQVARVVPNAARLLVDRRVRRRPDGAPDPDHEWPTIRRRSTRGRLAMVGLVRHQGVNPVNLSKSHQVLGYGVRRSRATPSRSGSTTRTGPTATTSTIVDRAGGDPPVDRRGPVRDPVRSARTSSRWSGARSVRKSASASATAPGRHVADPAGARPGRRTGRHRGRRRPGR